MFHHHPQACARSAGTAAGTAGPERARQILNQVEASGLQPDLATYNAYLLTLVRAVSSVSGAKSGRERGALMKEAFAVKAEMEGAGVMPDTRTYATLLHGLAKCVDRELQGVGGHGRHNGGGGGLKGRVGGRVRRFMGRGGGDRKEDDSLIVEWYGTGIDLLGEMAERQITPSEIIYNSMLDLCAKAAVRNPQNVTKYNVYNVYIYNYKYTYYIYVYQVAPPASLKPLKQAVEHCFRDWTGLEACPSRARVTPKPFFVETPGAKRR